MGFSIENDRNVLVSSLDEMVLTDGLVLYYTMDSIDGTTLLDNSGNNYSGTIYGATPITGINGNALSFNGTSNYVTVFSPSAINLSKYTLSGWFYRTDTVGNYGTILGSISGGTSWELESIVGGGGSTRLFLYNSSILTTPYSLNQWNFFTFIKGTTTASLYLNGNFIGSDATSVAPSINSLQIGRWNVSQNFSGIIDEVRIYNRALSAAEVKQLYKLNAPTNVASVKENQ